MNAHDQKRKEALRALMNIVMLEGMVLALVLALYLATYNATYLVGGLVGAALIFAPPMMRWARDHGPAMKAPSPANADRRK